MAKLRVEPRIVTLPLNQRVAFIATADDAKGIASRPQRAVWTANNLTEHRPARISKQGDFIASLPGFYRITASSDHHKGHVTIRVPEGITLDPNDQPSQITKVSTRSGSGTPPALPEPAIAGPGWRDSNFRSIFQIENRRGHDSLGSNLKRVHSDLNVDPAVGSDNYLLTIPVVESPGRGINVSLSLYYNSKVWLQDYIEQTSPPDTVYGCWSCTYMVFDPNHDWPAPGWSLGFGKALRMGSSGVALEDANGAMHTFDGTVISHSTGFTLFVDHTTDGTLVDYSFWMYKGALLYGAVVYPNGTAVEYGAPSDQGSALYPIQITDANGNNVRIVYRNNQGPEIQTIEDTLGRTVNFSYDSTNLLTAITVPGLAGGTRTVVRFHYSLLTLNPAFFFVPDAHIIEWNPQPSGIDAIYFPGNSTGYWFSDPDSYSSYGMIAKVSQRSAMTWEASPLTEQGTITEGIVMREQVYNYPLVPSYLQPGAPTYTQMKETWSGMDVPPAVTNYSTQMSANPRRVDIVYPDGTHVAQLMLNDPNKFDDGLPYWQAVYDNSGNTLQQTLSGWEQGDYESPRVTGVQVTDQLNQTTITAPSYRSPTNQIAEVYQYAYNGLSLLTRRHIDYEVDPVYANQRHIYNLPVVDMIYSASGDVISRTEYAYDHQRLADTPGVIGHVDAFNPYAINDYSPLTDYRGNVTQITRYADAANLKGSVVESLRYDIDGNVISRAGSCCEQLSFTYTKDTQFTYPAEVALGDPGPASQARVTSSFTYDYNTGLPLSTTDPNGGTTQMSYEPDSLRPVQITLPSSALISYSYDDPEMVMVESVFYGSHCGGGSSSPSCNPNPPLAALKKTYFNGLGLMRWQESSAGSGVSAVAVQYDNRGRLWKRSRPFFSGQQQPVWNALSYDALGRITASQKADGGQLLVFYDEINRPTSASSLPGETVRIVDAAARERWFRINALRELVEVIEPPASGGGLSAPGSVASTFTYNALRQLVDVVNGPSQQHSEFAYDSLGRLIAQYLPEKRRTLSDQGLYVGQAGRWSDVYTYDDHSNVISRTDARGVKTIYDYRNDPLDRLQVVGYGPSQDPANSVIPVSPISFKYMTTGDMKRLSSMSMMRGSDDSWGMQVYRYDSLGRLSSKQESFFLGSAPVLLNYGYDDFDRLTEIIYPAEYGMLANARKKVDYTYGVGGQLTDLQVDGVEYASQIAHNAEGQLTDVVVGPLSVPGRAEEKYTYDTTNGLLKEQYVQGPGALKLTYTYFPGGKLRQLTDLVDGRRGRIYDYDNLGRLVFAQGGDVNAPIWTQTYKFDEYGNRISVAASGKELDGSPIPLDGLAGSPIGAAGLSSLTYDATSNHISTPGFAYDAAGNQTRAQRADGTWLRFQYDAVGRLAQVTDDRGTFLEGSIYGVDGHQMVQITGTNGTIATYYFWNANHLIATYSQPNHALVWSKSTIYLGDRVFATIGPATSGEVVYYHHPDRLGTRLITNGSDGTVIEQGTLPFGTLLPSESPGGPVNPVFTSYDRSSVTGLDYAVHREYDATERFIQPDPLGVVATTLTNPQSLNLYSYVTNDPVNSIDPTGLGVSQCLDSSDGYSQTLCPQGGNGAGATSANGVFWDGLNNLINNVVGFVLPAASNALANSISGLGNVLASAFAPNAGPGWVTSDSGASDSGMLSVGIGTAAVLPSIAGREFQSLLTMSFQLAENTRKFYTSVANTVPDLFAEGEAIGEVKFVQYLYMTSQITAQLAVAATRGIRMYFFVAPETEVASTVATAAESTGGRVVAFDAMEGTLTDVATGLELAAEEAETIVGTFASSSSSALGWLIVVPPYREPSPYQIY